MSGLPPDNKKFSNPISSNGGFHPLTSNTTYTPNQFFDVCIPHYSSGVVRLVAFMIRKTLGWCDREGNPQESQIVVSYNELINHAGIGRARIQEAISEAISAKFIRCIRKGQPSRKGESAITALYELYWDESGEFINDHKKFKGFFVGEGNRTDIPNQFLDYIIPFENLSVSKTVASVLRFSIGFQAQKGTRRQVVHLSYDQIQRYSNIKNRNVLSEALKTALNKNYINRLTNGIFDKNSGKMSRPAFYSIKWSDQHNYLTSSKNVPVDRFQKRTGKPVPETYRNQFQKRTDTDSQNVPEDQSQKRTNNKIKHKNKTIKQQTNNAVVAFNKLIEIGFGFDAAIKISKSHPENIIFEIVSNQIAWIDQRNFKNNKLGMLRKAIQENWVPPNLDSFKVNNESGRVFASCYYAGYSGNKDKPLAEPSLIECEISQRYVERLLILFPEISKTESLGRDFGTFVKIKHAGVKNIGPALILALKVYGDEFYVKKKEFYNRSNPQPLESNAERITKLQLDSIKKIEKDFINSRKEDYNEFLNYLLKEKEELMKSPFSSKTILSYYDSEESRLKEFQKYFALNV